MHNILFQTPLFPLRGLDPVISPDIHTLVLCSYPGKEAFERQEYYAGTTNQFWMLMSAVLEVSLLDVSYERKLEWLLSHGIGLWDVISACRSQGALERVLQENRPDRFAFLKKHAPRLKRVAFNGQPAGGYAPLFDQAGYLTLILPSSSSTWSKQPLEKKLKSWRLIL